MKCVNCNEGDVRIHSPCTKCGITYNEMVYAIRHPEIVELMGKFDAGNHEIEEMEVYSSMLAAELLNSNMIMPGSYVDGKLGFVQLPGPDEGMYLAVYTDMDELEENTGDYFPFVNSWKGYLQLLPEDIEGFIINGILYIHRDFLDTFFNDEMK